MDSLRSVINDLEDRIHRHLDRGAVSPETKRSALSEIRELGADVERAQSGVERKHHIETYLAEERARLNADEPADIPDWVADDRSDSVREEPLCDCGLDCDVKRGRLPPTVGKARSIDAGIREFKHSHTGHPVALDEANLDFRMMQAHVRERLQFVVAALSSDQPVQELEAGPEDGEPPDQAEAAPGDD